MLQLFLNNLWRWKCGLPEEELIKNLPPLESLKVTEWSPTFEQLMRNRLIFGAIRYGCIGHGGPPAGKPVYDRCRSIRVRLHKFEQTGNAEWLVDIANMALLMFEERQHPTFHFNSVDDDYHDEKLS